LSELSWRDGACVGILETIVAGGEAGGASFGYLSL